MLRVSRRIIAGLVVGSFTTVYAATDCNQVTEIPVSECQSLLELYNNTDGANWRVKTGWNETNTPCSWFGITCEAGHVSQIVSYYWQDEESKVSNILNGQLPNFNLPYLKILDLSYNQLTGFIPNFSNLPGLQTLNLAWSKLSGNIPDFNLPSLQILKLDGNQLSGNIPDFSYLPNLEIIDLSYNQLTGNIPNFSNLPNLKKLALGSYPNLWYQNQLIGNIPNFEYLPKLEILDLTLNQLSGNIPNFNLPNLKALYLFSNQLSGSIPDFKLPSLSFLWLDSNQLSGSIPNFSYLPNLISLNASSNRLSGSVPNFSSLSNLNLLDISSNQLTGNIPNFSNLSKLGDIDVTFNQLSGKIPDFDLKKLFNLRWLKFSSNQLSGVIPYFDGLFDMVDIIFSSTPPANSKTLHVFSGFSFDKNCGLIPYNRTQEAQLEKRTPNWKTQNSDCSKAAGCPLVSVFPNLDIHLPHLNYNNMTLSANLRYAPRDEKLLFEVIDYSVNSESCASANLSPDFKLHIPNAIFGDIKLWADFQLHSIENDKITFELVKYGNA